MKESIIRKEIRDWLESKGAFCWPNITVGIPDGKGAYRKHPMPGIADISGVLPDGRAIAIEVKVEGHVTQRDRLIAQTKFISRINSCGGIGFFAYNLSDVMKRLESELYSMDCTRANNWHIEAKVTLDTMRLESKPNGNVRRRKITFDNSF